MLHYLLLIGLALVGAFGLYFVLRLATGWNEPFDDTPNVLLFVGSAIIAEMISFFLTSTPSRLFAHIGYGGNAHVAHAAINGTTIPTATIFLIAIFGACFAIALRIMRGLKKKANLQEKTLATLADWLVFIMLGLLCTLASLFPAILVMQIMHISQIIS